MLRSLLVSVAVGSLLFACTAEPQSAFSSGKKTKKDAAAATAGFAVAGDDDSDTATTTCAGAAAAKSYVGCDYWPTVLANAVWSTFDYAVIVANGQSVPATVTVTGANVERKVTVAANAVEKIYLPWVKELKGPDWNNCTSNDPVIGSVKVTSGAYHVTSSVPVTVYQFNALEFEGRGGPAGKSWESCPGLIACGDAPALGCRSWSNDASLLLPSTAMTGTYRVTGSPGSKGGAGAYFTVTATADNTKVTAQLPTGAKIIASESVPAAIDGEVTFELNRGGVAQVVGAKDSDLSGTLIRADKPVQVLSGTSCSVGGPHNAEASCNHLEEIVFPAETLGKHYLVAPPSAPHGGVVGHEVRFYGNVDGTTLTYAPSRPAGCPETIDAGQVVSCGDRVDDAFEVTADHELAIGSFMLSGIFQNATQPDGNVLGDPSQSLAVAVEQYRTKYVFLAPDDYTENWIDITLPADARLSLDGAALTETATPIGDSGFVILRHQLDAGRAGAHVLESDVPVGLQVMGFGMATSYQFPGGLDLRPIAAAPVK